MLQLAVNIDSRLKLLIAPECVTLLRRHPLLRTRIRSPAVRLSSIYFDTSDLHLKSKNIVLQLRKEGTHWFQTITMHETELAGLHTHKEWETSLAGNVFDFTQLDHPVLMELFASATFCQHLRPLFTAEFTRKTILIEFDGHLIECYLDTGKIRSGNQYTRISELDLTLKSGSFAKLFEFALELQKTIPLKLNYATRAEQGYALHIGNLPNRTSKAIHITINKSMNTRAACKDILRGCLQQLQDNTKGFVAREADDEYLHQMRVALRRMRSNFNLFSHAFDKAEFSILIAELKWLAGKLGPARNWDVFTFEVLPPISSTLTAELSLTILQQASEHERQVNLALALKAIESQRYQVFLLNLGAALNSASWPEFDTVHPALILDFANRILNKSYQQFRNSGKNIRTLPKDKFHPLRIAGKKLRYAVEFFMPLYPPHAVRPFLNAMTILQDTLGSINDAATANYLLEAISSTNFEALYLVRGWLSCQSRQHITELGPLWQRFKSIDTFWK